MNEQLPVIIVDDDDAVRESLLWLCEAQGLAAEGYASGEALLACGRAADAACLVLDMRLSGISGLLLFEQLKAAGAYCPPVIFLTGHADVPLAVAALKLGAVDFLEKPFDDEALLARIEQCLANDATLRQQYQQRQRVHQSLAQLTERERQVIELVLKGQLNKQIADQLAISMKTVEVHRARALEKMGVKSAVELASLLRDA
jgi:RNA polymerase sigma factor (sigma-70 family)